MHATRLSGLLLIICILLAPTLEVQAQQIAGDTASPPPAKVRIERVDLPGIAITQDHQGFMWFGGHHGLYRYDGSDFKQYQHNASDPHSLSYTRVEALHVDREGTLWIGTFGGGLNGYDAESDHFTHFRHDDENPLSLSQDTVTTILEDRQGHLWVGTHTGLNRLDRASGTFTHFRHDPNDPNSLSCDQVRVLYEDPQGTVWVGTGSPDPRETPPGEGGLNRFDPSTQSFTRFVHDPQDPESISHSQIMSLLVDSRGVFWVGTVGGGLNIMHPEEGSFTQFADAAPGRPPGGFYGGVRFIEEDRNGILWFGWFGHGLERYDPTTGERFLYHAGNSGLAQTNGVWQSHESHDGTLWIGEWDFSYKLDSSPTVFRHHAPETITTGKNDGNVIRAMGADQEGKLLIGTLAGMHRWDPSTESFTRIPQDSNDLSSLSPGRVEAFYLDHDDELWVGAQDNVLNRFNRSTQTFTRFQLDTTVPHSQWINALLEDRNGTFWVGLFGGGLARFNRASGSFTQYTHDPDRPNSLSHNEITTLLEDRDGTLWIGTYGGGLNKVSHAAGETDTGLNFTTYLNGRIITSIHEDRQGTFWITTWGDGLHRFDRATGTSVHYGRADGLPTERLTSLVEDHDGNLWITTSAGGIYLPSDGKLSRFDPETETVATFDTLNGLPDISFSHGCAWRSSEGTLFFGGVPGFISFHPDDLKDSKIGPPKIVLTGLRVFNEEVEPGENAPLQNPINLAREIRLSHDQNDFTIDYKALSYHGHGRTLYYYRLEPHDAEWMNAHEQQSARYSGLAPGRYTFRVHAVDGMGNHSNEASIGIVVLSPWWRTPWAYAVYIILFAAGVFAVDRIQRRRLLRKERERARERELQQAREIERAYHQLEQTHSFLKATQAQLIHQEKMASLGKLTAGVAHEIKNPLNFVNNFAALSLELVEELRSTLGTNQKENNGLQTDPDLRNILDILEQNTRKIEQHGKRADGIIRAMLEHSRGSSGEKRITDINALVEEYITLAQHGFSGYISGFSIVIERNFDPEAGKVHINGQDIGRVLVNLLNNAFYAVWDQSRISDARYVPMVRVSTFRQPDHVEIYIQDNGPGIPPSIQEHVFEPFFTTKPTGHGTGLGLSLAHEIITQGYGGTLSILNTEMQGATFIITLPAVPVDPKEPESKWISTSYDSRDRNPYVKSSPQKNNDRNATETSRSV